MTLINNNAVLNSDGSNNVRSSMFEAKNRVFEFDHQLMNTFVFVRCSKNDVRVRSMFDKMVFDPSLSMTVISRFNIIGTHEIRE